MSFRELSQTTVSDNELGPPQGGLFFCAQSPRADRAIVTRGNITSPPLFGPRRILVSARRRVEYSQLASCDGESLLIHMGLLQKHLLGSKISQVITYSNITPRKYHRVRRVMKNVASRQQMDGKGLWKIVHSID
jgi:hypothetical protein